MSLWVELMHRYSLLLVRIPHLFSFIVFKRIQSTFSIPQKPACLHIHLDFNHVYVFYSSSSRVNNSELQLCKICKIFYGFFVLLHSPQWSEADENKMYREVVCTYII